MKYNTIVWDWNGTLLDDVYICMECVNDMLRRRNMKILDLDTYKSYVDTPIIKAYEHIFDLSVVTFDIIVKEFYESYGRYKENAHLIKGAEKVLSYFKSQGCRQSIITAANTQTVQRQLEDFGISVYFDNVLGASDFQGGSKLDRATMYAHCTHKSQDRILAIGDTTHDSEMADAIGADCILFSGGHQDRMRLENTGRPVVNSLMEIPTLIG